MDGPGKRFDHRNFTYAQMLLVCAHEIFDQYDIILCIMDILKFELRFVCFEICITLILNGMYIGINGKERMLVSPLWSVDSPPRHTHVS